MEAAVAVAVITAEVQEVPRRIMAPVGVAAVVVGPLSLTHHLLHLSLIPREFKQVME
jgi:hypothetical protein